MERSKGWRWVGGSLTLVMAVLLAGVLTAQPLSAHHVSPILVNSTSDGNDALPGNGVCETASGNGVCTLRAAIQEGEASGRDSVSVPAGTYVLTLGDLDITKSLAVVGAGSGRTIIDGGGNDRVIEIGPNAFFVFIAELTVQNGKAKSKPFSDYRAHGHGGGIHNHGQNLHLHHVTIYSNGAATGWGSGGFFNAGGSVTSLTNVTVSTNAAPGNGGGIENAGTMHIMNVTVTGNVADSDANGFGDGGGIWTATVSGVETRIAHSLIAHNADISNQAHDCSGPLNSQGYNLIHRTAGCTITGDTTGNLLGVNPLIGGLDANKTHPLLSGSPAIDGGLTMSSPSPGSPCLVPFDQRSQPRPQDGNSDGMLACDIGAYEFMPPNLLKNGGFELDANKDTRPDNWRINAKFTRVEAQRVDGMAVGQFRATDNSGASTKQTVAVSAGRSYFLGCWANIPTTSDAFTFKIRVKWFNSAGSVISTSTVAQLASDTAGLWRQLVTTRTAPTGAVKALFQISVSSLNGTIHVDHCVFR